MKKVLLVLLCLFTLAIALGAACEAQEVRQGDVIELNVHVEQSKNVLAGSIELIYDHTVLEIVSGEWLIGAMIKDYSITDGRGVFAYAMPVTVGGDVFRLTARVIATDPGAHTELVARVQVIDPSDTPVVKNVPLGEYIIPSSSDLTDNTDPTVPTDPTEPTEPMDPAPPTDPTPPTAPTEPTDPTDTTDTTDTTDSISCMHDFSAMNATEKYLHIAADCTSPATYFYSCLYCAAKGTNTFEYGDAAPHTYDREVTTKKYLKTAATEESPALYYTPKA